MKQLLLTGFIVYSTLTCLAQTSETRYYKSASLDEEASQDKAKYSKTITNHTDSSTTTEVKNIKKNLIESRITFKGEEPVGLWIYLTGRGPAEMDYDFPLVYSTQNCATELAIKNYFINDSAIGYEAPKISSGDEYFEFIAKNLVYPAKARKAGIQGKVELSFDLTENGAIENIRVKKGVHVLLDKEAVRILRKMKLVSPPKVNGQAQSLCTTTSLSFRLQ